MTFKSILALGIGLLIVGPTSGQGVSNPSAEGKSAEGKSAERTESARKELTPQQQLKRIETEFQAALDKLQQEFRQAETKDQRQEIEDKYQELQRAKVAESLELAVANRQTELAEQTFSWVFRTMVLDKARQIAKDQWLEEHVNDACLAPTLAIMGMADEQDFLRDVIKRASNKTVLGAACFNLAMSLRRSEALTKKDEAEVISLLERIENEFANIMFELTGGQPGGRLGDLAAPPLREFKCFSVGKVAPEIAGEDIDGVQFGLSEYRGKVVLLSFWGDW